MNTKSILQDLKTEYSGWNIWLIVWALLLSFCWLVPNHNLPWQFFQSDVWAALVLLTAVPVFGFSFKQRGFCSAAHLLVLLLVLMPMAQYASGLILQFGTAWIATAYLVGLMYSMMLGSYWESKRRGQVIDGVLLAIGIAALASVGMQIYQWFGLEDMGIWIRGAAATRQSANLGQPNHLASLLLMGCMSIAWAYQRKRVGGVMATFACTFIATGIALTGSRTAWVSAAMLIGFMWVWRGRWRNMNQPWVATWLLVYLLILGACLPFLRHFVFDGSGLGGLNLQQIVRTQGELRLDAWTMFLQAVWTKPWLGYGWAQIVFAQAELASSYPQLHTAFQSSHNLLLDILLSCGIPIGLAVIASLAYWVCRIALAIGNAENAIVFLSLMVIFNHSMLELPLYYGYFLWPAGILLGALIVRTSTGKNANMRWYLVPVGWVICMFMLVLTAYDYWGVEDEYQSSTMNEISITSTRTLDNPRYIFLTQWDDFFKYGKLMPVKDMQDQDILHLQNVVLMWPTPGLFNKLAMALATRNRPEEAALWLQRLCSMTPEDNCHNVVTYWQNVLPKKGPEFARVKLPSENLTGTAP